MKDIFSKILLGILRYVSSTILTMLAILTLATGKFPPPIMQTWQDLKQLQKTLGNNGNLRELVRSRKEQQDLLASLDRIDDPYRKINAPTKKSQDDTPVVTSLSIDTSQDETVKALEWQNKVLTQRLQRCQQLLNK